MVCVPQLPDYQLPLMHIKDLGIILSSCWIDKLLNVKNIH